MSSQFVFKEVDEEGEETLDTIGQAKRFNQWMYDTIRPHCTGKILEIGSGIGNISEHFIGAKSDIVLSDVRDQYCNQLKLKFKDSEVLLLDLVHPEFDRICKTHFEKFDSIFALNVIEHIKDDQLAMSNIKKLLKPNGQCLILVPAFDFLYNSFDRDLCHFRRYNRKKLNLLLSSNFKITMTRYFNPIGILGWYFNGNILKKKQIPSNQMQMFDRFVPVFKLVDLFTRQLCGLSVIAVGQKDPRNSS